MPKLPDIVTSKGLDFAIHLAGEGLGEIVGELAADHFLGRRGQDDSVRQKFFDLLKAKDKEGLQNLIKTNQLGWGQGDEQTMEDDIVGMVVAEMATEVEGQTLVEFFYCGDGVKHPIPHCLTERERTKYRRGHVLQKNQSIRYRNLAFLAKMRSHEARRRQLGAVGKLDRTVSEKGWDYLTEETPESRGRISELDRQIARERGKFFEKPPSLWQQLRQKIGR